MIVSCFAYGFLSTDNGQINAVLNGLGMASVQWYQSSQYLAGDADPHGHLKSCGDSVISP